MNNRKPIVGITGANGFVGLSLFKYLQEKEYRVRGIIRSSSSVNSPEKIMKDIVRVDYSRLNELINAFNGLDVVVHCAARSLDWGKRKDFFTANVQLVENVVKASAKTKIKRIIHISTANIEGYGSQMLDETSQNVPHFKYSKSKWQGENMLKALCEMNEIDYVILRPSAIYGPGDFKWSYAMIERIKNRWWPLINNGNAKFTPLFIENLLKAVEISLNTGHKNSTYNLTDNYTITWRNFSDNIAKILNVTPHYKNYPFHIAIIVSVLSKIIHDIFSPRKEPTITPYRVIRASKDFIYSCKRAINDLNYKPESNIYYNLTKTVEWYNSLGGKY